MDLIYNNGGSVNKILGDTVVCSFSSVIPSQKDEVSAVKCVKAIRTWLKTYQDVNRIPGFQPQFELGRRQRRCAFCHPRFGAQAGIDSDGASSGKGRSSPERGS